MARTVAIWRFGWIRFEKTAFFSMKIFRSMAGRRDIDFSRALRLTARIVESELLRGVHWVRSRGARPESALGIRRLPIPSI